MGSVNLDNTGSGSAITLSSDGTSLLLNGTAIGGSPDLYGANPVSATDPSAGGNNSIAIGSAAVTTNTNSIAIGTSSDADSGGVAIGYSTHANSGAVAIGGLTYGANASGAGSVAIGGFIADAVASTSYAVAIGEGTDATAVGSLAIGNDAQAASGQRATALTKSYASGTDSFAAAIANNSSSYGATGSNSVAMGYHAKATGNHNIALGGTSQATGSDYSVAIGYMAKSNNHSSVAIGREAGASGLGTSSIAIGHEVHTSSAGQAIAIGKSNIANGWYSVALGNYARTNGIQGKFAYSCDYINNGGDAQTGMYVLNVSTTDATATALTTTGTSAGSNNQLIVQNNSAYAFHGTIVAREKASEGTDCAAWKVEGLIRREANAGTTVLVNSATTVLNNASSWGMALSADTTNGCLKIAVTGAASTNIRWVGTINTSELTYA